MSVPSAPDRTYDRVRYHRGSRGFAAFVTGLNAAVLLGLALFVTPTLGLSQPAASWFVILVGGAGIAHVAAIGPDPRPRLERVARRLPRRRGHRRRVRRARRRDRSGDPRVRAWNSGRLLHLDDRLWLVATRFALKAVHLHPAGLRARPAGSSDRLPDARPLTGLRKVRRPALQPARTTCPSRPLPTPRIIHPTPRRTLQPAPSRPSSTPISTPTA